MPTITILEKLYNYVSPKTIEKHFLNLVNGLNVQLQFVGITNRCWIQINISGDDETAALNLFGQKFGIAPDSLVDLKKFSVTKGKIISFNKDDEALHLDLGINSKTDAVLSKQQLCAQLADGKNISLQDLIKLFCMYENIPLEVMIIEKIRKNKAVDAVLSETQIFLFKDWIRHRFDRLIILGSLFSDINKALKLSRHSRDIIKIESLGLLEQVVLCKLGTDAIGLIPKLGRYLGSSVLVPFSPKKILETVDSQSFDFYP
jgi:hypothetical protein